MRWMFLVVSALILGGCATELSVGGEKVRMVDGSQKAGCQYIKLITVQQSLGPNKPGNALKKALNETAAAGGNSFYLVNSSSNAFDGASVAGEALRCDK